MFVVRRRAIRVPKRRPTGATSDATVGGGGGLGARATLRRLGRAAWYACYPPEKRPLTNEMGSLQAACCFVALLYLVNINFYASMGDGRWSLSEAIYFLTVTFA
jgi:hypothetical protein